jgi:hypothetical protein
MAIKGANHALDRIVAAWDSDPDHHPDLALRPLTLVR